jgi:hypothetical protein
MAYTVTPMIGVDLNNTVPVSFSFTNGSTAVVITNMGPLGTQVWGSDGKRYVLASCGNSFSASAAAQINATTFVATTYSSGTSYAAPAVALASGDVAWFGAASV